MKVRLPVVIKDTVTSRYLDMDPFEEFFYETDDVFLDGPVTRRVAVLDFDPKDGTLSPPVPFQPPGGRRTLGRYQLREEAGIHAVAFMKVSVFATVLRTMRMFEEPDTLGRPLTWAFNARQLLIVPRAGEWTNAYYERRLAQPPVLLLPLVPRPGTVGLYQPVARHRLARDGPCDPGRHRPRPLQRGDPPIAGPPRGRRRPGRPADGLPFREALPGGARRESGLDRRHRGLQRDRRGIRDGARPDRPPDLPADNLRNEKNLDPDDRHNGVARDDPHALSEVLGGTLYAVMLKIHGQLRSEIAQKEGIPEYSASGKALASPPSGSSA